MQRMQRFWRLAFSALSFGALALVAATAFAAAGGAALPAQATLRLSMRVDTSKGVYIEGAYYYATLSRPGFRAVRRFTQPTVVFRFRPGSYVLRAYARPCDGNCGYLDPPMDGCKTAVAAARPVTLRGSVVFKAGSPCRLAVFRSRTTR
jgi:hypothetical protein